MDEATITGSPFHSGFVAVIGRANVGKSTLVNRMVGHKVSIVTARPQTTRNRILGIVNRPTAQLVMIDTPGLHRPDSLLGRHMMGEISQALNGIDAVAVIIDASAGMTRADRFALDRVRDFRGPVFLILNKIDRMAKSALLPLLQGCAQEREFAEMIPVCALSGDGVEIVSEHLIQRLAEGTAFFPKDQFTDQPERVLAAELVREKAMAATKQEVPQAVNVTVESFEESDKLIRIRAVLEVEREGQKGILIGRGGERLKQIGTEARTELEEILGIKIFLELMVKVVRDWREDPRRVRQLDWRLRMEDADRE